MPASGLVRELARAKINLALHVVGRREDGYHRLDSLVAFASIADTVSAEPRQDGQTTLSVTGPFAPDCPSGSGNLILKAVQVLDGLSSTDCAGGTALYLNKQLPVASGIGGGSADAAAAIRALVALRQINLEAGTLRALATTLGADVPMCLESRPLRAQSIGDIVTPLPSLPSAGIVLVNPMVALSTPVVFRALETRDNPPLPDIPAGFADLDALVAYLDRSRNDLEPPAETVAPIIRDVLADLRATPGCLFGRMSGSGATCFGLFADAADAALAASAIEASRPGWWVASGTI